MTGYKISVVCKIWNCVATNCGSKVLPVLPPNADTGPELSCFTSMRTLDRYWRGKKYVVTPAVTMTRKKVRRINPIRTLMVRQ